MFLTRNKAFPNILAYHRLLYHVAASGVGNAVPSLRNRHLLATLSVVSSYVYLAIAHQASFNLNDDLLHPPMLFTACTALSVYPVRRSAFAPLC
jgi:hypothetical protein